MIKSPLSLLLLPLLTHSSTLKLFTINTENGYQKARCNDHSEAKFYSDHEEQGSTKWIIYFESGGGCSTQSDCLKRFGSSKILMSSGWLDEYSEIEGQDILSTDEENPFHDYNHVYLPYCSSDMYVGMNDWTAESPDDFSEEEGNFFFAGNYIVEGLLEKLKNIPDVQFTDMVLAGSSAGGIGVMNHIKIIKDSGVASRVRGIVDSSWFINFEDNFLQLWNSESANEMTAYQSFPHNECKPTNDYGGMPCCFRADCLEHHGTLGDVELLFIQSKNDIYLLQNSLISSVAPDNDGFDAIALSHVADIASSYSGAMMLSVNSTKDNTKLSYYITSCLQHVYLAPSSFWNTGEPLNKLDEEGFAEYYKQLKELDLETFPIRFNQIITPKTMYSVKVGPPDYETKTLSDVISQWAARTSDSTDWLYIQDGCVGIDCNPTCPDQLDFVYTSNSWSDKANITVMAILGTITVICLVWKVVMMVLLSWLQVQQRNNLGTFAADSFIPALGPSDMMSVSCVDLSHSITYVIDKDEDGGGRGSNFKKLQNDLEGNGPLLGNGKVPSLPTKPSKMSVISHLHKRTEKKEILKNVSVYFNPSSFVGIMGPSGCGKTTFLDVVTGRRETTRQQRKKILIDGQDFDEMKEEFTKMLAYVLQLERPYHEALTVRENLTFEALMRLPKDCPLSTVFNRVETVLLECGLDKIADAVVGGDAGGGISGGQKRKLCVALQLIDYPSIIFLDEPTSGLDSTSSYELMTMLSKLQVSKRCIVLTIHQPRQEIFHLFTHILLLVGGQVAYYGSPLKAYGVLETALKKNNMEIKDFVGDADIKNEADLLMDMLNNEDAQEIMIKYYQETELNNVRTIIDKTNKLSPFNKETIASKKKMQEAGGFIRTVLALESRIMLQQSMFQILYLPLIFLFVPLVLGYVYYKAKQSILIISVYCVVTCMGPLFMTSIIMNLINDTLRVFLMQYKDGIGCLYHVVFMVFYRLVGITTFPMLLCSITIYFLVNQDIDFSTFLQVTVILIALCQAWMGVFSAVVYAGPTVALKICPMVSALSAFTSGFLVPEPNMPDPFWVLFFINPTFWAIQAIAKLLLKDRLFGCEEYTSKLSCQINSGNFNLHTFGFLDGNPVTTGIILLCFIVLTQLFSVWVLLYKHSPEPIPKVFMKWLSNLKCSVSLPRVFSNGKVADGELVIIRKKNIEPRYEWARVIGKVIKQQQETFTAEIEAGRIIESTFLEGIGHFLYRRGTNSETILESHNRNYRNQNGVTDEMLERIILILRNGLKTAEPKPGDRRPSSVHGGGEKGGFKIQIQKQAEMQVHNAILANRAHQLRLGSKFKAAGNTVKNAKRLNSDGIDTSERGGITPTSTTGLTTRDTGNTPTSLTPSKQSLHASQSLPIPIRFSTEDPLSPIPGSRESDRPDPDRDGENSRRRGSAFGDLDSARRGSSESDQFKLLIRNLKPRNERSDQIEDFEEHRLSDVMETSVSDSNNLGESPPNSPEPTGDEDFVTLV